ncbi:DUF805 domain-containing protein [Brevundimonas intermedia]|uniref:DUF805 domain-containing protein n=1 Tax=Brevundimonas intermedia TaxID=74315 RepID=UPI003208BC61
MKGAHDHSPVVQSRAPGPNLGGGASGRAFSWTTALRGEILSYDPVTGDGLISGDDLQRYAFTSTTAGLEPGRRVDFAIDSKHARDIIALSFTRSATATTSAQAVAKSPAVWQNHFLSFKGRIGRVHFWAVVLVLIGIQAPYWLQLFPVTWHLKALLAGICLWPYLAASAKRLHDLDRRGVLAILPVAVSILLAQLAIAIWLLTLVWLYLASFGDAYHQVRQIWEPSKTVARWLLGSAVLIQLAFIAWLGFVRGSTADNRFGPPPSKSIW